MMEGKSFTRDNDKRQGSVVTYQEYVVAYERLHNRFALGKEILYILIKVCKSNIGNTPVIPSGATNAVIFSNVSLIFLKLFSSYNILSPHELLKPTRVGD